MRIEKAPDAILCPLGRGRFSLVKTGRITGLTVLAAGLAVNPMSRAVAADGPDPVLTLMLEKGMITQDEAAKVQAQVDARLTNSAAPAAPYLDSKWKISSSIKSVELFGDLRTRFEDRSAADPAGGKIDLQRYRYAARVGLKGDLFDDFYYGFRLETSANPRSSWVTMGTQSGSSSIYQGPFGKSPGGINIGQIYLGWKPDPWFEVTAGKMPNPLYTTPMVWSPSLSPEGLAEHFRYTVGEVDLFANLGQFLYQDVNPVQSSSGFFSSLDYNSANQPFLLAWQGGVDYHLTKTVDLKVAPALCNYIGGPRNITAAPTDNPDFGGTFVGQGGSATPGYSGYNVGDYDGFYANQTGINDLFVLDIPFELNFKRKSCDLRLFGDYAQNLDGAARAEAAYTQSRSSVYTANQTPITAIASPQTHDNKAYQVGVAIGSTNSLGLVNGSSAGRHAWEVRTYWQHVEQYSLDPNLIDTDFFSGDENMQGIYAAVAYGFTGNFIGTFRYGYASRINDKLGTGGSGQDIPQMNPINEFQLIQVDLTVKF